MLRSLIWLPALLIAVTIHEFAHAFAAEKLGDPTPRLQGRLTLNPLSHLDPIGTLMLFIFHFGWGKPVEFDPFNLRHPKRDTAVIALSGPVSNLILAILLSIVIRFLPSSLLGLFLIPIITLNISLAIFNLLPIPPLDGSKVLYGILPGDWAEEYNRFIKDYGTILLIIFIFPFGGSSIAVQLISPIINLLTNLLI